MGKILIHQYGVKTRAGGTFPCSRQVALVILSNKVHAVGRIKDISHFLFISILNKDFEFPSCAVPVTDINQKGLEEELQF